MSMQRRAPLKRKYLLPYQTKSSVEDYVKQVKILEPKYLLKQQISDQTPSSVLETRNARSLANREEDRSDERPIRAEDIYAQSHSRVSRAVEIRNARSRSPHSSSEDPQIKTYVETVSKKVGVSVEVTGSILCIENANKLSDPNGVFHDATLYLHENSNDYTLAQRNSLRDNGLIPFSEYDPDPNRPALKLFPESESIEFGPEVFAQETRIQFRTKEELLEFSTVELDDHGAKVIVTTHGWEQSRLKAKKSGKGTVKAKTWLNQQIANTYGIQDPKFKQLAQIIQCYVFDSAAGEVYVFDPSAATNPPTDSVDSISPQAIADTSLGKFQAHSPLFLFMNLRSDELRAICAILFDQRISFRKNIMLQSLCEKWILCDSIKIRQEFYAAIGKVLARFRIACNVKQDFRLASFPVLYMTKGQKGPPCSNITFKLVIPKQQNINAELFFLAAPQLRGQEDHALVETSSHLLYPKNCVLHINGSKTPLFYTNKQGELTPLCILWRCKLGDWNTFRLDFELDLENYKFGLVAQVVGHW